MSWSAPLAFWFALSLVVIFVLHGIRMFRRRMPTTTLWIWRQLAKESQSSLRLNRVVRNLPLLLQLLLAALLVLALAQPLWFRKVAIDRDVVLIVDASASMNARTSVNGQAGSSTRFDEARKAALNLVGEMHGGQRMALVEMAHAPRLVASFTPDTAKLKQAIEGLSATDARADLKANLLFGLSLAKDLEQRQLVLIGDGAYRDDDGSVAMLNDTTTFIPVGEAGDNVAITQFAYRAFLPPLEGGELLLTVRSFGTSPRDVTASIALDGTPPLTRGLNLPPGSAQSVLIPVPAGLHGVARAQLLPGDELGSDDRAFAVIAGQEPAKVLLVGEPDPPLHAVLQSLPALEVTYRDSAAGIAGDGALAAYDLVLFNRVPPPPLERGTVVVLGGASPAGGVTSAGWVDHPRITSWRAEDPLLRSVDVQRLEPGRAQALIPAPGTDVVVDALEGALITRRETGLLRVVTIGFDLRASRISAQDAFPLLMANLVESARRNGGGGAATAVAAGEGYVWRHRGGAGALKVTASDGRSWDYPPSDEPLRFDHTERVGIYTFEGNGGSEPMVVNLLDDRESQIARNPDAVGRAAASGVGRGFGEVSLEGWPWFVAAGLLFLLAEWLVWSRFT
jgi:hypothetical protein